MLADTEMAIEATQEAEALVTERKRQIKIAERCKVDWITVQYLKNGGSDMSGELRKRVQVYRRSSAER